MTTRKAPRETRASRDLPVIDTPSKARQSLLARKPLLVSSPPIDSEEDRLTLLFCAAELARMTSALRARLQSQKEAATRATKHLDRAIEALEPRRADVARFLKAADAPDLAIADALRVDPYLTFQGTLKEAIEWLNRPAPAQTLVLDVTPQRALLSWSRALLDWAGFTKIGAVVLAELAVASGVDPRSSDGREPGRRLEKWRRMLKETSGRLSHRDLARLLLFRPKRTRTLAEMAHQRQGESDRQDDDEAPNIDVLPYWSELSPVTRNRVYRALVDAAASTPEAFGEGDRPTLH